MQEDTEPTGGSESMLPGSITWVPRLWKRVRGFLKPAPKFYGAWPEMRRDDESEWQWWHVPVSVKRSWLRRDIPCCEPFVVFIEGELKDQEHPLRWRSDLPAGSSEVTLLFGKRRMIPLAARRDQSPAATLTDNEFLMQQSGSYSLAGVTGENVILGVTGTPTSLAPTNLNPGLHRAKIKIVSGHSIWESDGYKINVPQGGKSNSHFTVTAEN